MPDSELLDLVCGPASPLPETYQRYRLVAHLGSGGQAEVYRAVRLCGGVTSAPMTVKVFRVDPCRPLVDELRSWDKGDAALMDLNNRGVSNICRRADGFYGPSPHRPGETAAPGDAVPYQIYDYLHGINLRQYVAQRVGLDQGTRRVNAVSALRTLSGILRALHYPQEPGATPVLHMDIKPANLMVLTNGEVRLIDFTGARYWRAGEITQIAYTPESGGPEAFAGAAQVGPAYDVHGFGAVAFHLVTGLSARVDAGGSSASTGPDRSVVRRHPGLDQYPVLRDHLSAPLADRPGDRPDTRELDAWVNQLGDLVRRGGLPDVGVDWFEPKAPEAERSETGRAIGRATARPAVTGTETEAFQRIERLERELVELRASGLRVPVVAAPPTAVHGSVAAPPTAVHGSVAAPPTAVHGFVGARNVVSARARGPVPAAVGHSMAGAPAGPRAPESDLAASGPSAPGPAGPKDGKMRGRAKVPTPKAPDTAEEDFGPGPGLEPEPWHAPSRADFDVLKRGWRSTGLGGLIAFVCWGMWAVSGKGTLGGPLVAFVLVLAVAAGVFAMARLIGRLVLEQRLGRVRRSARGAHALTGLFLASAGFAYLQQTPWVLTFESWLQDQLG